ncbi:SGNH/GDSL hydrolase family protein [Flexivirga caeni]|uniref:SGNH/GDSL hydrolase family protein n=2 Tax=Flexivirga caeni TaxID=2294115 RepID=A0A3M9MEH7_9MICO|nr:SGNH/GDSL hydrolase family protein [Flexivirga caeni]
MVDASPTDDDAYVGWADRLAAFLARENDSQHMEFGYANLAIRGKLLADVTGRQLDDALALQPDLVSIVAGGNDCLRPQADLDALADDLERAVVRIRETGADVLMATSCDPTWAPFLKVIGRRVAIHTANVWGIAARHDAFVLDTWTLRSLRDVRMWGPDRLHLSTLGHQRVAAQAAWTLGLRDGDRDWAVPLPPAPPLTRLEAAQGHAAWARTHLAPWIERRLKHQSSGDHRLAKRPELSPVSVDDAIPHDPEDSAATDRLNSDQFSSARTAAMKASTSDSVVSNEHIQRT